MNAKRKLQLVIPEVKVFSILFIILLFKTGLISAQNQKRPVDYVNTLIGTGGHGHTFPGALVPFGMVQPSPDTRIDGSWDGCSGYHASDSIIYGFSNTHLSGTGCSDYGDIMLMPALGGIQARKNEYTSAFDKKSEKAEAGYYSVQLKPSNIKVELSAGKRVAWHRYSFPKFAVGTIILDLRHRDILKDGNIHILNSHQVDGFRNSKAWADNQKLFFKIDFSKDFISIDTINQNGKVVAIAFHFQVNKDESIIAKVALSSVDEAGAANNMLSEATSYNFDNASKYARELWNQELSKIKVEGKNEINKILFYSALYHCMVHPSLYSDVDGKYRGMDDKIHSVEGYSQYTVFSLWDTFRALHPLFNLIERKRNLDFIKTFLAQFKQSGRLPIWELSNNETNCMIAYHAVSLIADAYVKGIRDFDVLTALDACEKTAFANVYGLPIYHANGFLSSEDENESVSKTLEYAYNDWCIWRFAKEVYQSDTRLAVKNKAIQVMALFNENAGNWKNLLDSNGFMHPRYNGGWYPNFEATEVNNHYTEANAYQYSLFVPHDIPGLIRANGGKEKFIKNIDRLFNSSSATSGRNQADISGMIGQYAHGNEPSHHMAYLYNYCGKSSETQKKIRQILSTLYHNNRDGLPGNEDCGQMSAWYVMSAIGLYPTCPGNSEYAITTPLFDKVIVQMDETHKLIITCDKPSEQNPFISSVSCNDFEINKENLTVNIAELNRIESTIKISNSAQANDHPKINSNFKSKPEKALTHAAEVRFDRAMAPVIRYSRQIFEDTLTIIFESPEAHALQVWVFYADGNHEELSFPEGNKFNDWVLRKEAHIQCQTVEANNRQSSRCEAWFYRKPQHWKLNLQSKYNNQYTGGGVNAVIDGLKGDINWRKGRWQGYFGQDFIACIQLDSSLEIHEIQTQFIHDPSPWIFTPQSIELSFSDDSIHFTAPIQVKIDPSFDYQLKQLSTFRFKSPHALKAKYVRVLVHHYGKLPEWHESAGQESWLFIDEIEIK